MGKNRKIIIIAISAVVILAGILGGFAVANADDTVASQNQTLLDKVVAIYQNNTGVAINADELQKAFDQARVELKDAAIDNYLSKLVEAGKITEQQKADIKAWLDARPQLPTDEFRQWLDSRPDVDVPGIAPGIGGFGGMHRGMMDGFGGMGRFGGMRGGMGGWSLR
ncbi:MAG: hypothetical protein A2Z29_00025 [Chloroflexi bacterium RBG_16_56_11]|nr:MAG: hypothetical protein A2Z29_00025 [Chloroflexi bacterium RBG_16_56_11]